MKQTILLDENDKSIILTDVELLNNIEGLLLTYADGSRKIKTPTKVLKNLAFGKPYVISRTNTPLVSQHHPISFNTSLTDGKIDGTMPINPGNNSWFAFQTYHNTIIEADNGYGSIATITLDLGTVSNITKIRILLGNAKVDYNAVGEQGELITETFIANQPKSCICEYVTDEGAWVKLDKDFDLIKNDDNVVYWSEINLQNTIQASKLKITLDLTLDENDVETKPVRYALIQEIEVYGN